MFSKNLFVTFLSLALSSYIAQVAPFGGQQFGEPQCSNVASTVVHTVTVTAAPGAATSNSSGSNRGQGLSSSGNHNNNNNNGNNNQNQGKGNQNSGSSKNGKGTTTTQAAAATSASSKGNQDKNKGGQGGTTSSTAAAATSTASKSNNSGSSSAGGDPQSSLTLDPKVIAPGFANNGQDVPTAGQVASLTSTNNFINFCLTVPNLPITNGKQISTGSCNPAPIGVIPSTDNMPSAKFTFPANFGVVKANTAFTISMAIQNMQTGFFVNAEENYFAAPQVLNAQGQIQGHSHVVVEQLTAIDQTKPTDPKTFAFFKGLNSAAVNGLLTADVTDGLPAGVYKLSSINSAANHQPVIVPVAQHGSLDDAIYFTVTDDGQPPAGSASTGKSTSTATTAAASSSAAASKSGKSNNDPAANASTDKAPTGKASTVAGKSNGGSASSTASAAPTSTAKSTGNGKNSQSQGGEGNGGNQRN